MENNLKKLLIGLALVSMPLLALAADLAVGTGGTRGQIRQEAQQERQGLQAKRQAFVDEMKAKREEFNQNEHARLDALKKHFGDVRAQRIEVFFGNMVGKFDNAIARLNSLADRISAHLDKLVANGKDVTAFRAQLEQARAKIQSAAEALSSARTKFGAMTLSTNPKASFKEVKNLIQSVAQKVKDAHRALVELITSIKGSSGGQKATTTESH